MQINEIRRERLRALIDRKFGGNAAAFARAIGRKQPNVSRWLTTTAKDQRAMSEEAARDIEQRLSLPKGYLDHENDSSATVPPEVGRLLAGLSPSSYQQWLGYGDALLDAQPTGASYDPSNTDVVDALRNAETWKEQSLAWIDDDLDPTTTIQRIDDDSDPATTIRKNRNDDRARRGTRTVKDVK